MANNWTYLMYDPGADEFKIGQSVNPFDRIKAIRTERPHTELISIVPDHSQEKELHQLFDEYRHDGEWFGASAEIIAAFSLRNLPILLKQNEEWSAGTPAAARPELEPLKDITHRAVASVFGLLHLAAFLFLMGVGIATPTPNWSAATIWPLAVMLAFGLYGLWLFGTRRDLEAAHN